jgi:hypothetical protein
VPRSPASTPGGKGRKCDVSFLPGAIRLFGHLTRLKMLYYMCDPREGIGSPLGNGVAKLWGVQDTSHEAG